MSVSQVLTLSGGSLCSLAVAGWKTCVNANNVRSRKLFDTLTAVWHWHTTFAISPNSAQLGAARLDFGQINTYLILSPSTSNMSLF
jgi:hypothetical protein